MVQDMQDAAQESHATHLSEHNYSKVVVELIKNQFYLLSCALI